MNTKASSLQSVRRPSEQARNVHADRSFQMGTKAELEPARSSTSRSPRRRAEPEHRAAAEVRLWRCTVHGGPMRCTILGTALWCTANVRFGSKKINQRGAGLGRIEFEFTL